MPLLIRSWNVFHGNAKPTERRAYLDGMLRLVSADRPDVVCLQEVPPWAFARLGEWSGMTAVGDVVRRPSIGPLPATASVGRLLTAPNHGRIRSLFTGQGNAILVKPGLRVLERHRLALNPFTFRRRESRRLGLDLLARLAWANEPRACQAVRVAFPDGRDALVANLHASNKRDDRMPDAELLRAATFADALAGPEAVCILAGDFNVSPARSRTLADLVGPDWGFSAPRDGIDQILVRGAATGTPTTWPTERRVVEGRRLSDHAPVELRVE